MTNAQSLVSDLVDLLNVQRMGDGWYLGKRQKGGVGRVFGGQVIAQALAAAQDTVAPERIAHSLHAYFMRPGNEDYEITYRVERDFTGGSFSTRRVIAMQQDKPILNLAASFQKIEPGFHHQELAMPDVPSPDGLRSDADLRRETVETMPDVDRAHFLRERPIEYRPVNPRDWVAGENRPAMQQSWFRTVAPLPDDPALHRAVIAYASDSILLGTCTLPHGVTWGMPGFQSASLDHALWLHDEIRADEWLLYSCDAPWAGRARGFNRGSIFTADGRLVASVAQEGLIRYRPPEA
jgi:acyl-CoA thioesterase II